MRNLKRFLFPISNAEILLHVKMNEEKKIYDAAEENMINIYSLMFLLPVADCEIKVPGHILIKASSHPQCTYKAK